ncbi:MAG: hypothetical protein V3U29_03625, partial [Phycisphaeraceae bacterium]
MTVFLDDQQTQLDGQNLGAVLAAAKDHLDPTGRVIVEVQLDGQPLIGDDLANKQNDPIEDHELRLYSVEPAQLGVAALEQVREALDRARQNQTQAAELLQQDQPVEAMNQINQAFDIWLQAQQAVMQSARLAGLELDEVRVDDRPLTDLTDALIDQLKSMRDLLAASDTVALADALAYEWPETIDQWQAAIGRVIEAIEKKCQMPKSE